MKDQQQKTDAPERPAAPISPAYFPTVSGDLLSRTNLLKWIRTWAETQGIHDYYTMEFGVLNGEGSVDIIRQLRSDQYRAHYGFDSFEGFGEISGFDEEASKLHPSFSTGGYRGMKRAQVHESIKQHVRFDAELHLTEGFFKDSLPKFDKTNLKGFPLMIYVDCDLYQSSKECFDFIEDIVEDGTWILCDDYWCYRGKPGVGQRRAIDEWVQNSKRVSVTPYCNFRGFGRAFIVNIKD